MSDSICSLTPGNLKQLFYGRLNAALFCGGVHGFYKHLSIIERTPKAAWQEKYSRGSFDARSSRLAGTRACSG